MTLPLVLITPTNRPNGSDSTGDATHGVKATFLALKSKLNDIITELNAVGVEIAALPAFSTGTTGLALLATETVAGAQAALNAGTAGISVFESETVGEIVTLLNIVETVTGSQASGTMLLPGGYRLNWAKVTASNTGTTESWHTAFTTCYGAYGSWTDGEADNALQVTPTITDFYIDHNNGSSHNAFVIALGI